ncbi:YHYH protein [Flavobacteriaceae bacterium]|nr:YHYH protein [Flavobacteriaceae bacterium]
MKSSLIKNTVFALFFLSVILFPQTTIAHTGHDGSSDKVWSFEASGKQLQASYVAFENETVYLRASEDGSLLQFPLTDFGMKDQLVVLELYELSAKINRSNAKPVRLAVAPTKIKIDKEKGRLGILLIISLFGSVFLYFGLPKQRKFALSTAGVSLLFLVIVACSVEDAVEEPVVNTGTNTPPPTNNTDSSSDTSDSSSNSTDSTTDTSTDDSSEDSSTTDSSGSNSSIAEIVADFADFSGVNITSDDTYFYIESYSWPEHQMGVGITAWQEQVPIPQNYIGDNSWAIPLNPEMADTPLDTSEHLLKGALAVAVNGVPIFNVLNNRGENSFLLGELDNWGGHFGRGDDYHYHKIPTHLEETVGTDSPLAYALDGYPVYGYTDEALDDAFGRYDSDNNYRYHAKTTAPYYMPLLMGKVTLDPSSTAPEDQIYPQAVQNAVRRSDDFKPVNNAEVTAFTQTGKNAFSFEYTVSGTKYYVNYNWDDNCDFTYTYVDENGGTTNLPSNGAIGTGTGNVETFTNVTFCADVNLYEGGTVEGSGTTTTEDSTSSTEDSSSSDSSDSSSTAGYSVTSANSNFTLSSSAIDSSGEILSDYQCEEKVNGVEKSIPLSWSNVPEGTGSLAISIHALTNTAVVETNSYLTLWNIDPSVTEIAYGGANDGDWYMGPNKDGVQISYTSPCNPSTNYSTYYITIYALSETPSSLPTADSLLVDYDALIEAIETVTLIDKVELEYLAGPAN